MKKLIVTGHYIQLSEDGKPNPALCERPERFGHVYLAPDVDARIAELEGWLDRLLPSWREAEARDYEEALVTSYRHQIAELENALREATGWNWLDEDNPPPQEVIDQCNRALMVK